VEAATVTCSEESDRYRKRAAAMSAAVTESGRPLQHRRPLQEAAVTGGRYRERAAAETAAVT
jgi:hypothetical protein